MVPSQYKKFKSNINQLIHLFFTRNHHLHLSLHVIESTSFLKGSLSIFMSYSPCCPEAFYFLYTFTTVFSYLLSVSHVYFAISLLLISDCKAGHAYSLNPFLTLFIAILLFSSPTCSRSKHYDYTNLSSNFFLPYYCFPFFIPLFGLAIIFRHIK